MRGGRSVEGIYLLFVSVSPVTESAERIKRQAQWYEQRARHAVELCADPENGRTDAKTAPDVVDCVRWQKRNKRASLDDLVDVVWRRYGTTAHMYKMAFGKEAPIISHETRATYLPTWGVLFARPYTNRTSEVWHIEMDLINDKAGRSLH